MTAKIEVDVKIIHFNFESIPHLTSTLNDRDSMCQLFLNLHRCANLRVPKFALVLGKFLH